MPQASITKNDVELAIQAIAAVNGLAWSTHQDKRILTKEETQLITNYLDVAFTLLDKLRQ